MRIVEQFFRKEYKCLKKVSSYGYYLLSMKFSVVFFQRLEQFYKKLVLKIQKVLNSTKQA